jgi:glycosyltransferase involved in cell wall biosynthesis
VASEPLVSVVVPAHNSERYLGEALDSVFAQTRGDLEVVLVDDGSTDGTVAVAESYEGLVVRRTSTREGPGGTRNEGMRHVTGEYLAFLDADDLWEPMKLELQLAALAESDVDVVFGHVQQFRSPELDPGVAVTVACPPDPQPALLPGAMLMRTETFHRVGKFGTTHPASEFLEWLMRAQDMGMRRTMLPQVVLHRRLHETNFHRLDPAARADYALAIKASLDRRRAEGAQ